MITFTHPRVRQIFVYTIPSFFSKATSLILVPLYASFLSVKEFGQLELLLLVGTFLQYTFHLGWGSAHIRYFNSEGINPDDLNRTLLWFRFCVQILILLLFISLGAPRLATWATTDSTLANALVGVVGLYLIRELILFYETRYRALEKAIPYALVNGATAILQLILVPYLLIIKKWQISAVIYGQLFSFSLVLAVALLIDYKWLLKGRFKLDLLHKTLRFGLPLVPAAIAMFMSQAADRYMLNWLIVPDDLALQEVGLYSLAFKFVALLSLITAGFKIFWMPFVYANYQLDSAKQKFTFVFRVYTLAIYIFSLSIITLSPLIFYLLPKYENAIILVPVMLAGALVYNIGDYFCIGIGIKEKNKIRSYTGVVVIGANLFLNFILIPKFGSLGAALATATSYILYTSILMYFSHKLYPVNYAWSLWITGVIGIFIGFWIVALQPQYLPVYFALGLIISCGIFYLSGGTKTTWRNRSSTLIKY